MNFWFVCTITGDTLFANEVNKNLPNKFVGARTEFAFLARAKKKIVPPLFQMWGYKQANISRDLLNNQFVQKQLSAGISWLIVFEYISKHGKVI